MLKFCNIQESENKKCWICPWTDTGENITSSKKATFDTVNQSWTQICKGTIMAQLLFWTEWSKVTKLGLASLLFL